MNVMRMLDEAKVCNLAQFKEAYEHADNMAVIHIIGIEEIIPIENFPRRWLSHRKVATVLVHWDEKNKQPGDMFILYVDSNTACSRKEQYVHLGTLSVLAMKQGI